MGERSLGRRSTGVYSIALAVLIAALGPLSGYGADRVVLAEYFTSTNCTYCEYSGQALDRLLNNYPAGFANVQYHWGDPWATSWGVDRATAFYGATGIPITWFDGMLPALGAYNNVDLQYSWYLNLINQRAASTTDVLIDLGGEPLRGDTYRIKACVCLESTGVTKTVRLYIVQVLDHYPASPTFSRNAFMQALPTQDLTLEPGHCAVVERQITFDAASWAQQQDIKVIAWVQDPLPTGPAEVHQAAVMSWPFMIDCNGNGVPDECDLDCGPAGGYCDVPGCGAATDCNTNGLPDDCEPGGLEDCNTNGVVDLCDVAEGACQDCNGNVIPDECEVAQVDCNSNGVPDDCDVYAGTSLDCNTNVLPDECEVAQVDCNTNGVPDDCDVYAGTSLDCNADLVPDECEVAGNDCNTNGVPDDCDIQGGVSPDCDLNGLPDECDLAFGAPDCNTNGIPDACDMLAMVVHASDPLSPIGMGHVQTFVIEDPLPSLTDVTLDFEAHGDFNLWDEKVHIFLNDAMLGWVLAEDASACPAVPDTDQIVIPSADWNTAAAIGRIEILMEATSTVDPFGCVDPTWIQVTVTYEAPGPSGDCNTNAIPDDCDIASGTSYDVNQDGIPDECQTIEWCLGDSNCSLGAPDFMDIQYFVAALGGQPAWEDYHRTHGLQYDAPPCPFLINDMNANLPNGVPGVEFTDIPLFVEKLSAQECVSYSPE